MEIHRYTYLATAVLLLDPAQPRHGVSMSRLADHLRLFSTRMEVIEETQDPDSLAVLGRLVSDRSLIDEAMTTAEHPSWLPGVVVILTLESIDGELAGGRNWDIGERFGIDSCYVSPGQVLAQDTAERTVIRPHRLPADRRVLIRRTPHEDRFLGRLVLQSWMLREGLISPLPGPQTERSVEQLEQDDHKDPNMPENGTHHRSTPGGTRS